MATEKTQDMLLEGTLELKLRNQATPQGWRKVEGIAQLELTQKADLIDAPASKDRGSYGMIPNSVAKPKPIELKIKLTRTKAPALAFALMSAQTTGSQSAASLTDQHVTVILDQGVEVGKRLVTAGSVTVKSIIPAHLALIAGTVAPTTEGTNGNYYLNTTDHKLYGPKAAGVWGTGAIPSELSTATGKTLLSGVADPTSEGADTNWYVNTVNYKVFGPKATTWPTGTALAGVVAVAVTFAEGADYEFDYQSGTLTALTGGEIADGETVHFGGAHPALTWNAIAAAENIQWLCMLRLIGTNLADSSFIELEIPEALITADSAIDFMSDKHVDLSFSGRANGKPPFTLRHGIVAAA